MITTLYQATCDNTPDECGNAVVAATREALMETAGLEGWTWYGDRMHCGACPTWCEEKCGELATDEDGLCDSCYEASQTK